MHSSVARLAALLIVAGTCAACVRGGPPPTLRVLAGSELSDMTDVLDGAREATGVRVELTFSGTLEGAERIAAGSGLDAAWFSSDRYLALVGATSKVRDREPIMLSPVVLGVRRSIAARLRWTPPKTVGWSDVASAASAGDLRFAMTDPTSSNSGFSALVGVATALNGGRALGSDEIDTEGLLDVFSGQSRRAASSGDLAEAYARDQRGLDGLVNYESVLLELNAGDDLDEPLELIYPDEGIVTADYPLLLLDDAKRDAYRDLVAYLRRPDVQDEIQEETGRRPATSGVPLEARFPRAVLVEAPFPPNLATARMLLQGFDTEVRQPAHIVYVIDSSGSMDGEPLQDLKDAMTGLAGLERTFGGLFTRPPPREHATVLLATTEADGAKEFEIDPSGGTGRTQLRRYIGSLEADGNTILWTSLLRAYELAGQSLRSDAGSTTSIVVLSDGDNTGGISYRTFQRLLAGQTAEVRAIPTYALLFGDPPTGELEDLARRSGGKVFDARGADLSAVAKEIRGYQ